MIASSHSRLMRWTLWIALSGVLGLMPATSLMAQGAPGAAEEEMTEEERKAAEEERKRLEEEERKRKEEEERKRLEEEERQRKEAARLAKIKESVTAASGETAKGIEAGDAEQQRAAEENARLAAEEVERQSWFPGYGVGLSAGWVFNDLSELNGVILEVEPDQLEGFDAAGQLRLEASGTLYLKTRSSVSAHVGGLFTVGGDTGFNMVYGGIEPALVFPDQRFEMHLGLRLSFGAYTYDAATVDGSVEGLGFEGAAMLIEPNVGLRYLGGDSYNVMLRLGFLQFLDLSVNTRGDTTPLGELPGPANNNALNWAGPTMSLVFEWGKVPIRPAVRRPPPPPPEDEGGDDAAGDDAGGDDAGGDDAGGDDAAGDDAGGDDAAGDDAGGDDAGGDDAGGDEG